MRKTGSHLISLLTPLLLLVGTQIQAEESGVSQKDGAYATRVQECVELLMARGTDRYGEIHAPILVSILDVESRTCPENPRKLDEPWRVTRRGRRNPAGANLLSDNTLLRTMILLSSATGKDKYADFARKYMDYYMKNLVDEKGFFWWGWHRHYDVYKDKKDGHSGSPHEIHAINCVDWEGLWAVNQQAVVKEIEAIWKWHVIDKKTGEINRHGDGRRGCDFSMSGGAFIEAFAFLYTKTEDTKWLDRAKLVANYYWTRRDPNTNLFPERPNAGKGRFDGSSFVTSITGLYCHSLLKAYKLTGQAVFKNHAVAILKAYAEFGFDKETGKFWGALHLDGKHFPGPRLKSGYAKYEPRGHLDLWEPYNAGYQYAIYTAQAYVYAYDVCKEPLFLTTAKRFADWIKKTPPGTTEAKSTWYQGYSDSFGRKGTYAGKYGRTVSFYLHLYIVTKDQKYLGLARQMADEAIRKLYHKGLFRGHPAKPYYETMDGVGYLLQALLELDQVVKNQKEVLSKRAVVVGKGKQKTAMDLDNW
ncbi:MAG: AGE family epimerase/isomerase [Phycisphaerae bacterium]|nr:AGE family epimerase/isomerase [Phycisphaerae bacterium]